MLYTWVDRPLIYRWCRLVDSGCLGRNPIIREGDFDTPLPDINQASFTSRILLNRVWNVMSTSLI